MTLKIRSITPWPVDLVSVEPPLVGEVTLYERHPNGKWFYERWNEVFECRDADSVALEAAYQRHPDRQHAD